METKQQKAERIRIETEDREKFKREGLVLQEEDAANYLMIIFEECLVEWGIEYEQLGKLVGKYKLSSVLEKHYEYFNTMGKKGVVFELREHIEEQGGSINEE